MPTPAIIILTSAFLVFSGGFLWFAVCIAKPAIEAHCKVVSLLVETNRSLQVSLLAYQADNPIVSSVAAKSLAKRAEQVVPPRGCVDSPVGEEDHGITMSSELS